LTNPTTPAEAKAFNEAMKTAKEADSLLDYYTEETDKVKKLDNAEQDLNTEPGIVATSGPFKSSETRDSLVQSQVLNFDPNSGEIANFSASVEGKVYRSTKRESSLSGRNYAFQQTDTYSRGPLVSLESETSMSIPDEPSRFLKATTRLWESSEGVFTYEVTEEEHNLYEK
jgi:hypothetical protein